MSVCYSGLSADVVFVQSESMSEKQSTAVMKNSKVYVEMRRPRTSAPC